MENVKEYIIRRLEVARDVIRARMEEENINASGRTAASLNIEAYDGGVRLKSGEAPKIAPFQTVQYGSAAGVRGGWFPFVLYDWSFEKGLNFETDRERRHFSFAAAKKIEREGTVRFNHPNETIYTPELQKVVEDVKREAVVIIKELLK